MSADDGGVRASRRKMLSAGRLRAGAGERWAEPLVVRLASETWRLHRRLERITHSIGGDERLRPLHDSLSRLDDLFAEYRVQVLEHDGQPYDPGLQVEVLHARDDEGNSVIVETVRPTVLFEGRVLQQGQVVIGAPRERESA